MLPKPGTICQPQELPLIGNSRGAEQVLSVEDEKVLGALRGITDFVGNLGFLGFT